MTRYWSAVLTLIALAVTGCSAGAGSSNVAPPVTIQSAGTTSAAQSAVRGASAHPQATPVPLASGLVDPSALALRGGYVYIGDIGSVDRVHQAGGPLQTILTGTSIFDSGSSRGVDRIAFSGKDILVGFGGYVQYDIVRAPIATGVQTLLATISGGDFIGILGTNAYYSRGFCCVDALPLAGGPAQTVLSGVWLRSLATDATSIYFVEYFSRNVYRFDVTTNLLTPLITGNTVEGSVAVDQLHVFFSHGTTIQIVAKQGGTVTTLYTGTNPHVVAVDDDDVFFTENQDLKAIPIAGGSPRTLVSGVSVSAAVASKRYIYYVDDSRGSGASVVNRIRTGP